MPRRPARVPLVGPLGGWELVRLARRGQVTRARQLVLYLLLLAFVLTPVLWFAPADPVRLFTGTGQTLAPAHAAAFANTFALLLAETLLLAVAAMTPGYAAAAIAEEKERQTLQLLLTTSLSDREVVLGKAAGRLGFVLAAAAAGVPVLAATTLFGGVSGWFLLAACGLTVSTAALATAVGLHAGCVAPDLRGALIRAYGTTAVVVGGAFVPPVVLLTPFAALAWLAGSPSETGVLVAVGLGYPGVQLLVAAGFLSGAVQQLRTGDAAPPSAPPTNPATFGWYEPPTEWREPPPLPPVDESDPLLWKERHVTGRRPAGPGAGDGVRLLTWGFGAVAVLLVAVGGAKVFTRSNANEDSGRTLMTGGTVALGLFLVPAAIGLAAAVARERHRQTLDALLALPVDRRAVLRAKARAVLERAWGWLLIAVPATGLAFGADGGVALGLAAAGFTLAGAGLVVGLGVWLTVRCPTEVRAIRLLVPAVVLVIGVPVLAWDQTDWWQPGGTAVVLAAGAVVAAGVGLALWRQAGREFERTG